jgi:hypothetical protein
MTAMLGGARWRHAGASGAIAVLLAGCGLFEQIQRIGVSSEDEGSTLLVHHVPCPGEALTGITLAAGDPEEGGAVIWQVTGTGGGGPYPVGTTPPGFEETVPLREIPPGTQLTLEVATRQGALTRTSTLSFDPASLEPGRTLTLGGTKDPATFERDARETCEAD